MQVNYIVSHIWLGISTRGFITNIYVLDLLFGCWRNNPGLIVVFKKGRHGISRNIAFTPLATASYCTRTTRQLKGRNTIDNGCERHGWRHSERSRFEKRIGERPAGGEHIVQKTGVILLLIRISFRRWRIRPTWTFDPWLGVWKDLLLCVRDWFIVGRCNQITINIFILNERILINVYDGINV